MGWTDTINTYIRWYCWSIIKNTCKNSAKIVTKLLVNNINGSNSNENNVYLAALNANTNTRYNKILSFWETDWSFTSYIYGMEIITSIEVAIIRLCMLIAAIFGDNIFKCLLYIMNELFAPK